ncbi:Fungal specific transcription factor domain-containing protein [Cladophialophora immunda]|nr:Fungal specific transcription factor domain-containing protein [Cladophialophora immunda]
MGWLLSDELINVDIPFELTLNDAVYSPQLVQEQLLNTFSSSLGGHGPLLLPRQMRSHQNWLAQLPTLFGSKLLDTAVRAVSLVHLSRMQRTELFVQESRQYYGKALRLLNQSLMDDAKGMSTETLSATILLSFYEMFASDSNQSWVRHAGGAGTLMRIRGPSRHLSGLDRDVYLAYRHTIVIDAFMRDDACFLAEPQWIEMSKKIHEDLRASGIPGERMDIFDLAEEFYLEHIFIPTTLRDARNLGEARRKLPPDQYAAHVEALLARTRLHRANLKSINLRFRATLKKQGLETSTMETMDPVFPKQYVFVNVFVASTHVGYWTIMVILNLILKDIERDVAPEKHELYLMENREISREMCRTAPFMLTSSFLGPFFITFALRLCLMVFEPGQERDWVVRKLIQIGDTHMRMASDIPPFDPKVNFHD